MLNLSDQVPTPRRRGEGFLRRHFVESTEPIGEVCLVSAHRLRGVDVGAGRHVGNDLFFYRRRAIMRRRNIHTYTRTPRKPTYPKWQMARLQKKWEGDQPWGRDLVVVFLDFSHQ